MTRDEPRPCPSFEVPKAGVGYPAYCGRCHYSRTAHEKWDEWSEAASDKVHAS